MPTDVVSAIRRAAAVNPLFALRIGPADAEDWRPAEGLTNVDTVGRLIADVGRGLGDPPARIAASMVVLGYSARLVAPTIATLLRDGLLLDVAPREVRWRYSPGEGFQLRLPVPSASRDTSLDRWCREVADGHLGPLVATVRDVVPVAAGLLWGNVASSLVGALRVLALTGAAPLPTCHDAGVTLLGYGPLRGGGRLRVRVGQLHFVRRSCCLYYQLPGGGKCGDCPLPRAGAVP